MSDDFDAVSALLDQNADDPASPEYKAALQRLRLFAESGHLEAAEALAEVLAAYGPLHDAAEAYKWYHVALSQQGYLVEFNDTGAGGDRYCGPDGDFRNEGMVSELVSELGYQRVKTIDQTVASWLTARGLRTS